MNFEKIFLFELSLARLMQGGADESDPFSGKRLNFTNSTSIFNIHPNTIYICKEKGGGEMRGVNVSLTITAGSIAGSDGMILIVLLL